MTDQILVLAGTAAGIGFTHTILGPDHYIPFIFMSKARGWTMRKTLLITAFCGLGHVLSSIAIGFIGIFLLGWGKERLEGVEGIRGNWAAIGFVAFGLLYMLWGFYRAYKNKPHKHFHKHGETIHEHDHVHKHDHNHVHKSEEITNITPWVLFVIFVLGPCEALIPMIIFPALDMEQGSILGAIIVAIVFAVVTLITMLSVVYLLQKGANFIQLSKFERYTHALAGAMLLLSGIGILFLGL